MILAPPQTFVATRALDVQLRLLPSAPRALKNGARVHFHAYSMEALGEIAFQRSIHLNPTLFQKGNLLQVAPGSEAFARIRLPESALLLPGDRFIIRQFSPVVTIGGGVVLDAAPIPGLKQEIADGLLKDSAAWNAEGMLSLRVARRWYRGLTMAQAVAETGWRREAIEAYLARPLAEGTILKFGDIFFCSAAMSALKILLPETLSSFHKKNPLVPGLGREELREKFTLSPEIFVSVLDLLVREKKIEVAGDLVRLPGRCVVMKDEEAESKKKIEEAFASAALKVPALHEVIAGLKIDKIRAQKIVTLLLRDKILTKVSDELVFHRSALEELRKRIAAQKAKSSTIDVATFYELTGVSRKYAIPLLEYLDRERVTKRVGDARQIL
jgi:selenocysteine-specific elongation factor